MIQDESGFNMANRQRSWSDFKKYFSSDVADLSQDEEYPESGVWGAL
jgi:hypothetical protein